MTTSPTENTVPTENRAAITGGAVLTLAMLASNGANYAANAIAARWADRDAFADASLIVTMFLGVTIFGIAVQLVAARRVSRNGDTTGIAWLRRQVKRGAVALGAIVAAAAIPLQQVFNVESALPILFLAVGLPFYLVHSVDRGVLQGRLDLVGLAVTFVVEAGTRLVITAVLLQAGLGATGVAAGLAASTWLAWLVGRRLAGPVPAGERDGSLDRDSVLADARLTVVLLAGQVLINNADVLIVKAVQPELAADYAGVALIGRAVFFLSWSIVNTVFPMAARDDEGTDHRLTAAATVVVGGCGLALTVFCWMFGSTVSSLLLGPGYDEVARLLWLYASATAAFAVTNLLASIDLANGKRRGPRLVVAGGVVQTVAVLAVASRSLDAIIQAQIVTMVALVIVSGIGHVRDATIDRGRQTAAFAMERS